MSLLNCEFPSSHYFTVLYLPRILYSYYLVHPLTPCYSADENIYTLEFLLSAPIPQISTSNPLDKMITQNGESYVDDVDMEDGSGEGEWIGLDDVDSD